MSVQSVCLFKSWSVLLSRGGGDWLAALEQSSLMSRFSQRERGTHTHTHTHTYTQIRREREILRSSLRRRRDCKTKTAGRKAGCASAGAP